LSSKADTALAAAISCKNLGKTFGHGDNRVDALKGITLDVSPGELLMLLGPSGSGKTTLISVMSGILKPSYGECVVLGESISSMTNDTLTSFRGRYIGFVFQAYNLVPMLTLAENVAVPLLIQQQPYEVAIAAAQSMLQRVGLAGREYAFPAEISGGQAQRVAVARAMVHEPKVIFCDEPTSALDAETGHNIMQLFQEVTREHGVSLVVVTHDARILEFADRIVQMEDGVLVDKELSH